jgi:diguanylate cyclase (GGDEF)-like protein/PAS domain S-box-containing protein
MPPPKSRPYPSLALPFGVLLVGLVLTLGTWRITARNEHAARQNRFDQRAAEIESQIRNHVGDYVQMLQTTAGLFAAEHQVSRKAWRAYVEKLDLEANFPGTLGLGYATYLRPSELPMHEAQVRAEGYSDYAVRPAGTRDEYTSIVYIEPFAGANLRAFGYDMYSEGVRREAMRRARDTARVALSGKVTLVQNSSQSREPGVLMYVPVYRHDLMADTPDERRAALQGYVYCPFRMSRLMRTVVEDHANDLGLELFDGTPRQDASLLFSTLGEDQHAPPQRPPSFQADRLIEVGGRTWTLHLTSLPAFDAALGPSRASTLLVGGMVITVLSFLITLALVDTRRRALLIAEKMSRAHRQGENRIRAVMDATAEAILSIGLDGRIRSSNLAAQRIFGYTETEMLGLHVRALTQDGTERWDAMLAKIRQHGVESIKAHRTETHNRRKDGSPIQLESAVSVIEIEDEPQIVCVCADITEQRAHEAMARRADALRQAILDNAPFCIISTDIQGIITGINPAGEALLGYSKDELIGKHSPTLLHLPDELQARGHELGTELGRSFGSLFEVFVARAEQGLVEQREWHYRRKDGSTVPVQLTVSALKDAEGRLTGYMGVASDITERKRTDEYIRHMALHDKLTGLPNRVLLQDHAELAINRARRQMSSVAVLLLDLDRFKHINDSLGHHVGDEVLQVVAKRLNACVRSSDTVVRMGGDEFVILLPDLKNPAEAQRVADKAMESLAQDLVVSNHMLRITPSIGIALYPDNGSDLSTLLKNADAAMYHAKDLGRNNVQIFVPQMNERLTQRLEIEADLSRAIERNELVLHYQPLVEGRSGLICGVEALIRWRHPKRGMVSPLDFIPIAEETGLILPIGDWVLRTACHDIKRLSDECQTPLRLAVNLSPRQFNQPQLVDNVRDILQASGLSSHLLELEITEGMLMRDVEQTLSTLKNLRGIGVHLAIDDFGTGFSSLSYLSRFPIQTLKVDRSFVKDIGSDTSNTAIASAVISMAHTLGLRVVAEGVETREQRDFLRARRCDELQGYLFSKPVAIDELMQRIVDVQAVCASEIY